MVEKLIQHRHCNICGKAISIDEELCSEKCKKDWESLVKRKKIYLYIFYIALVIFIISIFFVSRG